MNRFRVQVEVFGLLPLWKILPNNLDDILNFQCERVHSVSFNCHTHLDNALKAFSAVLFVFSGLHYATSLTTDFPSTFCTVIMFAFSWANVIWLGVITMYCAVASLIIDRSIRAIISRFLGSM